MMCFSFQRLTQKGTRGAELVRSLYSLIGFISAMSLVNNRRDKVRYKCITNYLRNFFISGVFYKKCIF